VGHGPNLKVPFSPVYFRVMESDIQKIDVAIEEAKKERQTVEVEQ
jgi:hypothetical protein